MPWLVRCKRPCSQTHAAAAGPVCGAASGAARLPRSACGLTGTCRAGSKARAIFRAPLPPGAACHPPGSCLRASSISSPRSPVHPPLAQVYMVQAPDGHVFALKQERFGEMSQADRRGWSRPAGNAALPWVPKCMAATACSDANCPR